MRPLLTVVMVALLHGSALANEAGCKNIGQPIDVDDALSRINSRIIDCFNYQQKLARDRDAEYRDIIRRLERRLQELEARQK